MSDTTTTEAPVEVEPFEDMSKDDMLRHLTEVHEISDYTLQQAFYRRGGRTKANLTQFHENQHKALDLLAEFGLTIEQVQRRTMTISTEREVLARMQAEGLRVWPTKPKVAHVHTAIPVSEAVAAVASALTSGKDNTPIASLNASERKALKDVVDNDFSMLKSEMRAMGADMKAQRRREVEAEWAERRASLKTFEAKARKALHRTQKALRDIQTDASAAGVGMVLPHITSEVRAEVKGFEQALRQADEQVERELERALLTLERQRLTAQRQVLLTGVSGEVAQKVLGAIPDAQTLMVEAAKASAAAQIGS
jgi:hypothetical protein